MRQIITVLFILFIGKIDAQSKQFFTVNKDSTQFQLTPEGASHLASLPLKCIVQEYPNKINHLAIGDSDQMITPHNMHPAFYGCLDWHSSVHGHWMLVKLLKDFPSLTDAKKIRELISHNISAENILKEAKYFDAPFSKSFERTYGWAWVLKLQQELNNWNDADAVKWRNALEPLSDTIINIWMRFLPKQTYPNRTGVHPNTAFGLVFALDYARAAGNKKFEEAIIRSAKKIYLNDKNAPAIWEPDGTDFLSPSLEEADLMRRVLNKKDFSEWFDHYFSLSSLQHLTVLPVVSDRNDMTIVHLDGLCFSRSWCMKGIASVLPKTDKRKQLLIQSSIKHLKASLPNVASGAYGGEHWLASFAVYAITNKN
ncbi:hypothetical protein GALL_64560 [mine drainage metagenome]|uniref:DUF2891 domain-containing protein n=1 Tax=mine drainage metagenome TaxID=410659 RepID=A0A1J5TEL7_9ZZZZ